MYEVGQIFEGVYPPEVSVWCDDHAAKVVKIAGGYQIVAVPVPTPDELSECVRDERDRRITACDWVVTRHAEQVALGVSTTLTADEYSAWLDYRQALRDMPSLESFPWDGGGEETPWPTEPV